MRSPHRFAPHDNTGTYEFILVKKGACQQMEILQSIAKMIDHSFLHSLLTDEELKAGCALARGFKP
jgi:hypothetical protein